MTARPSRIADYLSHIQQALARIENYTHGLDEPGFLANELVQDAVIRNLEVVGEACRNIERADAAFALRHPQLPLTAACEMRNVLAHGYFKIDMVLVWATVKNDLPALRQRVQDLFAGDAPAT
jgi:uncharacterized protein with HEPN domain